MRHIKLILVNQPGFKPIPLHYEPSALTIKTKEAGINVLWNHLGPHFMGKWFYRIREAQCMLKKTAYICKLSKKGWGRGQSIRNPNLLRIFVVLYFWHFPREEGKWPNSKLFETRLSAWVWTCSKKRGDARIQKFWGTFSLLKLGLK